MRRVRICELDDAPWNFRTHPAEQHAALSGTIDELGFYGYPDVYETSDGKLRLTDGHLRKELLIAKYGGDTEIEVNVTDFDDEEAQKATLTKDPLAAMAKADAEKLDSLMQSVSTGSDALKDMLRSLAVASKCPSTLPRAGLTDPDAIPEPLAEPITKPGDLWLLAPYWQCESCGKTYSHEEGLAMKECPCG